ncbi:MAG: DUF1795 domain-containing protein [Actinobacteria bacterium]|nr:DUF1795 domain-containing protein [Actinomycetota bacterium]
MSWNLVARRATATLLLVLLAVACGSSGGRERTWRDLQLTLPEGWIVFEEEPTRLSVADDELGEEGARGPAEAAAFFTHEPRSSPDDWRQLIEDLDGTLERDERISVGGAPATKLVFRHESNGVPLREMVVIIPSRDIVILMQPVVVRGQADGPDLFETHLDAFEDLLSSLRFGAPASALRGE